MKNQQLTTNTSASLPSTSLEASSASNQHLDFAAAEPVEVQYKQPTTLQVNGDSFVCKANSSLPELLEQMELDPRLVAVEYNGEILHRQYWQTTEMKDGDRLEIVTIVGGG
ncbi:MAG: thiamine biosynthesis protein ThiS [Cyanobacteria bacterium SBLK]|nr:thiamine biosynthesis protein ThiS [Cyanobacteria bacterium SBLK]